MKLVSFSRSLWPHGFSVPTYNKVTGLHWFVMKGVNVCIDAEGVECTYEAAKPLLDEARVLAAALDILET